MDIQFAALSMDDLIETSSSSEESDTIQQYPHTYKIELLNNMFDKNYMMTFSLVEFLMKSKYDWINPEETFTIIKGFHKDGTGRVHFTFTHQNINYHAYTHKHIILLNKNIDLIKCRVIYVTRLEIFR